jgi:hypothetical protein
VEFGWQAVMRPGSATPKWFVEAPHDPPEVRRDRLNIWKTLWKLALPWRFWRSVNIETPVRKARIAWWLVWVTVGLLLMSWAFAGMFAFGSAALQPGPWITIQPGISMTAPNVGTLSGLPTFQPTLGQRFSNGAGAVGSRIATFDIRDVTTKHVLPASCAGAVAGVFILVFCCLPVTRMRAKVRLALVFRVAAYSFAWFGLAIFVNCVVIIAQYAESAITGGIVSGVPSSRFADWRGLPTLFDTWGYWWGSNTSHMAAQTWWLACMLAWLFVYWWFALRRGLRMKEAPAVLLACGIPACIAGLCVWLAHPGTFLLLGQV